MDPYCTLVPKLTGTDFHEIRRKAFAIYRTIAAKTKRKPYIRSAYFGHEKIFLAFFWDHLFDLSARNRVRRLKFYPCALDLVAHSKSKPTVKINPNNLSEKLSRFIGITRNNERFAVQIKEDLKRKEKHLISIFPIDV
jgi:hypothetical protein